MRLFIQLSFTVALYVTPCADQKEFSKWTWRELIKSFGLCDNLAQHASSPTHRLTITPLSKSDPRLSAIVDHISQRLLTEKLVLPALHASNEAVASEYVSAVMTGVCLYFYEEYQLQKYPQKELNGELGRGPVDFELISPVLDFIACVTEVKKYGSVEQGCAQNLAQLNAVLTTNKRKRKWDDTVDVSAYSIGVVSNGEIWYVLKLLDTISVDVESDVDVAVRIAELPSLPLSFPCQRPMCIHDPRAQVGDTSSDDNTTSRSSDVSTAGTTAADMRTALFELLSSLIAPIKECLELIQNSQAAKRQKK